MISYSLIYTNWSKHPTQKKHHQWSWGTVKAGTSKARAMDVLFSQVAHIPKIAQWTLSTSCRVDDKQWLEMEGALNHPMFWRHSKIQTGCLHKPEPMRQDMTAGHLPGTWWRKGWRLAMSFAVLPPPRRFEAFDKLGRSSNFTLGVFATSWWCCEQILDPALDNASLLMKACLCSISFTFHYWLAQLIKQELWHELYVCLFFEWIEYASVLGKTGSPNNQNRQINKQVNCCWTKKKHAIISCLSLACVGEGKPK